MSLDYYWQVLRTQWRIVLAGLVLGLLVAGGMVLLAPRAYEATATIFVSSSSEEGASAAYDGSQLSEQRVKSYEQLLGGPRLARDVVDRLRLPMSPDELAAEVTASTEPETVLLTATVRDSSPTRAAEIANTLGDSFGRLVAVVEQPRDPRLPPIVSAQVVEPAEVPTTPVSPRPARDLALGLMVGLALGYGAALLRSVRDRTIRRPEALRETVSAPVVGVLPLAPELALADIRNPRAPGTAAWEALRTLRTNIQFVDVDEPQRVLVLTSAVPDEGKTTTSAHLATTFGAMRKRVLLVDSDLRRPRIADALGLEGSVGLTTVLTGQAELPTAVQHCAALGVDVLTSGPVLPNPSELLVSQKAATLLAELRRTYDYVFLDAPPVLPVTDAAALATHADGAVLLCRYGSTTEDQVRDAVDALRAVHARVLGAVLTMAPPVAGSAGYAAYTDVAGSPQDSGPDTTAADTAVPEAESAQDGDLAVVTARNGTHPDVPSPRPRRRDGDGTST
ncbi:polysaccharide biosynthesis tyrosine autokinase [Actinomycetospora aeridis]|uniref:non-specific protein-tyrosine kinase n=1 Tax=Actinomycetospora aeridis TaxID=3129231 RepID=A0ABU8N8Z3_9PSEU